MVVQWITSGSLDITGGVQNLPSHWFNDEQRGTEGTRYGCFPRTLIRGGERLSLIRGTSASYAEVQRCDGRAGDTGLEVLGVALTIDGGDEG